MGQTLTSNATMMCPHGGTITGVATNVRATADGGQPLHPTDTYTISGCPFQIPAAPSPIPSPCIQVVWAVSDLRVRSGQMPTLSTDSTGICIGATGLPQGTVSIVPGQFRVSTS